MRVVVVGGVAGGMSAAARLRRLQEDAEVIVLERGGEVSFANCGLPYYVGGEITDRAALEVQTPAKLKAALALDVRVNSAVTALDTDKRVVGVEGPEGSYELTYDHLILAPGAFALRPPIPGIDSPRVHTLRTVPDALELERLAGQAKRAVVLGAGFIGLEAAEALAHRGLHVDLVELAPHVLPPLESELATLVRAELERIGVTVHDGVGATAIESGAESDVVQLGNGEALEADFVVLSVGVRPDTALWEGAGVNCERGAIIVDEVGRTNVEGVWAVGDATVSVDSATGMRRPVPLAGPANRAGRLVADAISGRTHHKLPTLAGTAIVRVGKLTAALTGANRASLDAAGIEYETIHLHPMNHAGYFPGAVQMHLVVHFGRDGKLLGAQGVGEAGVDKRIDVFATALKAGMHMEDLIDLDLAYSPPFGSAKDPVNMAGMMASNVLDGTMPIWHATQLDDVLAGGFVLDVRSPAEYASGHLPGALNIAHTELRERLEEVRAAANGRKVHVHCASGMRSYLATRMLLAAGLEAVNLSGGMLTLRATLGQRAAEILITEGN
ncbi:MAG: FAD-dependent oxidoreductase [Buchananella hordeovulneris]|nr:FAD-dependent oxidoreductase [Buchananella hordeovulneris]